MYVFLECDLDAELLLLFKQNRAAYINSTFNYENLNFLGCQPLCRDLRKFLDGLW